MLEINKLSVEIDNKKILSNFNIDIKLNEIHVIMGSNGAGKSTICKTIMGDSNYIVTNGNILYNKDDLLKMSVNERSLKGIFYLNQHPIEIPGVTNAEMLRIALMERTKEIISLFEFNKKLESICEKLAIPKTFIHRGINEGMSGGERKKNEMLHLWMLEPKLILLDELDSGLDIDSLKIVCQNLNQYFQEKDCSLIIITHHAEILKLIKPTYIHILAKGKIVKSGDYSLVKKIEEYGYQEYNKANKVSDIDD